MNLLKLLSYNVFWNIHFSFSGKETASEALGLVNGYKLHDKPIIIQYGKNWKDVTVKLKEYVNFTYFTMETQGEIYLKMSIIALTNIMLFLHFYAEFRFLDVS